MVTFRSELELSSPTGPLVAVAAGLAALLLLVYLIAAYA